MKTLTLPSAKTGRLHTLSPAEILNFYTEHWLLSIDRLRQKLVDREERRGRGHIGLRNSFGMVGTLLFQLWDEGGDLTLARIATNLVVNTGRSAAIDRLQGTTVGVHDWMGIGTGTTDPAAGDTALETEIGTRIQGTMTQPTDYTDRLVSTFPAGNGTGALTEAGRFTAVSSGNMFCRSEYAVINKAAGDSLQITYDITD